MLVSHTLVVEEGQGPVKVVGSSFGAGVPGREGNGEGGRRPLQTKGGDT